MRKILIVDDEPLVRKGLAQELSLEFACSEAAGYHEAIASIGRAHEFVGVMSDNVRAPGGQMLLAEIRRRNPR